MSSENFDVWLFAVDLVNYVFLKCSSLHPDAAANNCPNFMCKSFTDVLKAAVQMIKESVRQDVDKEFARFQQQYELRPDAYLQYGKELGKARRSQRSDAESFLHFSVHMAFLAHCFYSSGDRRAQVSAVFVISDDYQHGGVRCGMWEALNRVAEKIVSGTVVVDKRQQPLQQSASDAHCFTSPEIETAQQSNERATAGRDALMKTVRCNLLMDCKERSKSKFDGVEAVSCSTRRRVNRRTREHALKIGLKPMPSLDESLESSMEELYISKSSNIKLVHEDGPLNSTAELELSWKFGKMNKSSPNRASIDRQIFRLSPISARNVRKFSPKSNTSFS